MYIVKFLDYHSDKSDSDSCRNPPLQGNFDDADHSHGTNNKNCVLIIYY